MHLDLAAILCHVEERVIGNGYRFSFAGRRYLIARSAVPAGMRRERLRVELRWTVSGKRVIKAAIWRLASPACGRLRGRQR